jgi:hypothetical protein
VAGGGYGFGLTPGQFLGLSAIELAESIARENRRRAYLEQQMKVQQQLGKDQADIDALKKQLDEVRGLASRRCLSPMHREYLSHAYNWIFSKLTWTRHGLLDRPTPR